MGIINIPISHTYLIEITYHNYFNIDNGHRTIEVRNSRVGLELITKSLIINLQLISQENI